MTTILFPKPDSKIWNQQNKGDVMPILFSTRNINLDKRGYIGLSRRVSYLRQNGGYGITIMAGIYSPVESLYKFIVGSGGIYNVTTDLGTFSTDTNAGSSSSTTASDFVWFNNMPWYSSPTDLKYLTGGTYTNTTLALNSAYPHPIAIFENKNIICVANGNVVASRTAAGVDTATALTLPSNFIITSMRYLNNKMYLATRNTSGTNTYLFEWDGTTASASAGYPVNSSWIMTIARYGQTLAAMTARGELLRFGGSGFTQLATLPFFQDRDYELLGDLSLNATALNRGMVAVDDYLYIFMANTLQKDSANTALPIFPGGIYQYHPDFGLVHKGCPSNSTQASITDFGQSYLSTPGMIMPLIEAQVIGDNALLSRGSQFLFGNRTTDETLTLDTTLGSFTSGESRGYFVTCKIPTADIQATQQKLWIKWKNMYGSDDKIVVKYRTSERQNLPIVIIPNAFAVTWTSNTTFTASSSNTNIALAQVGDEVEVMSGNGSGCLAHISEISNVGATYTVVLDEAITAVVNGNRGGVFIDNWTKIATSDYTNTDGFDEYPVMNDSKWVQFKIEIRGSSELQIEEMQIVGQDDSPAK